MAFAPYIRDQRDPFGRLPPRRLPDPEVEQIANPFRLSDSVGITAPNNHRDVAKIETLMAQTGNLDLRQTDGVTGYYGERLKQAVQGFQKQNNLKVDGLVRPRGETIRTLRKRPETQGQGAPEERRNQACQQLRKSLSDAQTELRGAQYLHDEASKAVNDKRDQVRALYEAYKKMAYSSAVGLWPSTKVAKVSAKFLGRNAKLPDRNLAPPSDLSEAIAAYEAYETAKRESEILLNEQRRAFSILEKMRAAERLARHALTASDCDN